MKIGILTSSRADYGIYAPLLSVLSNEEDIQVELIVFGMHLLKRHGMTVDHVRDDDFGTIHLVEGMPESDTPEAIVKGYGTLISNFSLFWNEFHYDWVFALGDRFEMSAAVQSSIPFEVNLVHLFGGETTLGATDNVYRHQISLASKLHFVSTETFKKRVEEITGESHNVHNVGSVSLDGIQDMVLPSWADICRKFHIPNTPFILITFHPETVGAFQNDTYSQQAFEALFSICDDFHVVITSTNADAMGSFYVDQFEKLKKAKPANVTLVDNFGRKNYFAAMKSCRFLIGNTSSGIIEAASFSKYVMNVGDRQKGRLQSDNIFNVPFDKNLILQMAERIAKMGDYQGTNIYCQSNTAQKIVQELRDAQL